MTKANNEDPAPEHPREDRPLRRAVTGAVQAITDGARAISGRFAALVGKSSGSIRAMNGEMRVIYELAPAFIRSVAPWLADYEVDEVVARMVDDELGAELSEWSFVRFPEKRYAIARRAVRNYLGRKKEYGNSRARADAIYLELRGDASAEPLSSLYATELEAAVERALKDLSPAHWETFSDIVYCGMSYAQAAARSGCSVSRVANRMVDCRAAARAVALAYVDGGSSRLLRKMRLWTQKAS